MKNQRNKLTPMARSRTTQISAADPSMRSHIDDMLGAPAVHASGTYATGQFPSADVATPNPLDTYDMAKNQSVVANSAVKIITKKNAFLPAEYRS